MKRNVLLIGIVVIVVAVAALFFGLQQMNANAAATAVRAQTTTAQLGTLVATVSAAGNISTPNSASLAFQTSGKVAQVSVQVGDKVKQGQVLMTLDPTDLQLSLKTAQTSLANAQASLDSAKIKASQNVNQLIIAKTSLDKAQVALQQAQAAYDAIAWRGDVGGTTQAATLQSASADYRSALANYNITASNLSDNSAVRTAQAQVDQAQISVDQAQKNLDNTKLVALFDGYVAQVNFAVGDTAGTGAAVVIADLSKLQVGVTISEVDIAKIKVGQAAQLTLDALPGQTYDGKVISIGPVGTVTQGVVNYPVIISVSNPDASIMPGMTANLAITVDQRQNVLLVPLRAVRTQGNQKIVTVLYQGQQIAVPVTVGLTNDQSAEITSGLKAGDEVVLNATQLRPTNTGGGGGGLFLFGRGG